MIIVRSGQSKVSIEEFYGAEKPVMFGMLMLKNIVISNLIEIKNNSKYLMGYLDEVVRPLVSVLPEESGYVKTFKVKDGDKDKNSKLISLHINHSKLLENYKAIWTKIEDL